MSEIDNVTRERIREWQIRRLEIKDQMHLHPEKTLALSKVLDLMDSEHADILSGSKSNQTVSAQQGATLELTVPAVHSPIPVWESLICSYMYLRAILETCADYSKWQFMSCRRKSIRMELW